MDVTFSNARTSRIGTGPQMRVGVIGAGLHAGINLYPSFPAAGLRAVAICARDLAHAKQGAQTWGAAKAFADPRAMLVADDLDGVVICVPPGEFGPLVRLCLEAGKPVFCEKPGAASAAEAAELAELSERLGVPVVVGYMKRFAPAYVKAREIIESPGFGTPTLGTFMFAVGEPPPGSDGTVRDYLVGNPVHVLDIARFLLGELDEIEVRMKELPPLGHAVGVVATSSGGAVCALTYCTSGSWFQRNEYAEIYGEGHSVSVENCETCVYRPPLRPESVWRPNYTVPMLENVSLLTTGFILELEHFREVAMEGRENRSDLASAARTLALAERIGALASRAEVS